MSVRCTFFYIFGTRVFCGIPSFPYYCWTIQSSRHIWVFLVIYFHKRPVRRDRLEFSPHFHCFCVSPLTSPGQILVSVLGVSSAPQFQLTSYALGVSVSKLAERHPWPCSKNTEIRTTEVVPALSTTLSWRTANGFSEQLGRGEVCVLSG